MHRLLERGIEGSVLILASYEVDAVQRTENRNADWVRLRDLR